MTNLSEKLDTNEDIERNIQEVIDECWDNEDIEPSKKLYRDTLFPNGKPTPQELLTTLVKKAKEDIKFDDDLNELIKIKNRQENIKIAIILVLIAVLLISLLIISKHLDYYFFSLKPKFFKTSKIVNKWWDY